MSQTSTYGAVQVCRTGRTVHIVDTRPKSPIHGCIFCYRNLGRIDDLRTLPDYAALVSYTTTDMKICTACKTNAKNAGVIP